MLGRRKLAAPTCRDEILDAMDALRSRTGTDVLTVHAVYAEMMLAGTAYAEATVFKTMQRMKEPPVRPPFARLERLGRAGFRLDLGDG